MRILLVREICQSISCKSFYRFWTNLKQLGIYKNIKTHRYNNLYEQTQFKAHILQYLNTLHKRQTITAPSPNTEWTALPEAASLETRNEQTLPHAII